MYMYVRTYVCMNVCMCMYVTKLRVKDGVCESDVCFLLAIFCGSKQDISIAVCISRLYGLGSQAEGQPWHAKKAYSIWSDSMFADLFLLVLEGLRF